MMKKHIALVLAALVLMAALPALAQAQEILQGMITGESGGSQFLLYDETYGEVLVKYDQSTVLTGLYLPQTGQYVAVTYSGVMTRSEPPQVTALSIECYMLYGVALAYDVKTHTQLIVTPDEGQALVRLPETAEPYAPGDFVAVSYNGLTDQPALGQVNAYRVDRLENTQGEITEMADGWLLLGEGEDAVRVNLDGSSQLYGSLYVGETVVVYSTGVMTFSLPPQIYGAVVLAFDFSD